MSQQSRQSSTARGKAATARRKKTPAKLEEFTPTLRQFELAVRHSPDFVGAFDLEGKALFANAAALHLAGLSKAKLKDKHAADFFVPEEQAFVREVVLPAALKDGRWLGELTLQHFATSARIPVSHYLFRIDDPETGQPAHYATFTRDLTEQKRRENELHEAQARVASVLVAGEVGTWSYDVEADFVVADANLTRFFNLTLEEAARGRVEDYLRSVHPDDRPSAEAAIARAIQEGPTYFAEYRISKPDGSWRHVIARGIVERDETGKALRLPGVVLDISARKEAEAAVRESEAKFRQLADTIPQLAWMADAEGWIFWYNQRWYEYTGTSAEAMAGWGWQRVHDPALLPVVIQRWQASIASGEPFDMIFPLKGADGNFRRFLTRVMPFRNQQNEITLWFGTNTDVEEQKRAAEALQERREQLSLALEAGQLGTWQLVVRTMEFTASDGCKANFGLPPDAPFDYQTQQSLIHPDDLPAVTAGVQQAITKGESYAAEYRVKWPDGDWHWISARGRLVAGSESGTLRLIAVTQDITEHKLAEEQRERVLAAERAARAEAEHVGRMKDEFLATLSHELRTPLNAIFGWTQLIKSGGAEPALVTEGIEVIDRNVRVQTQLIEDLLDMSRVISGKLRLDVQHLDPGTSINAAIETVSPAAEAKGIRSRKSSIHWPARSRAIPAGCSRSFGTCFRMRSSSPAAAEKCRCDWNG